MSRVTVAASAVASRSSLNEFQEAVLQAQSVRQEYKAIRDEFNAHVTVHAVQVP
jgi:hypothetical protein